MRLRIFTVVLFILLILIGFAWMSTHSRQREKYEARLTEAFETQEQLRKQFIEEGQKKFFAEQRTRELMGESIARTKPIQKSNWFVFPMFMEACIRSALLSSGSGGSFYRT